MFPFKTISFFKKKVVLKNHQLPFAYLHNLNIQMKILHMNVYSYNQLQGTVPLVRVTYYRYTAYGLNSLSTEVDPYLARDKRNYWKK